MSDLKTDYRDDVLDVSANAKRIFNLVDQDGNVIVANVSIQDITKYTQEGDTFGAADINATNEAVNGKLDGSSTVDPMLTTEEGFAADALAVKKKFDEQKWKFLGSVADRVNIKLPSEWTELNIIAVGSGVFQFNVPRLHIETFTTQSFHQGFYDAENWYAYCLIKVTKETACIDYIKRNGSVESGKMYVYYK